MSKEEIYCELNIKLRKEAIQKLTDSDIAEKCARFGEFLREVRDSERTLSHIDGKEPDRILFQQMELLEELSEKADKVNDVEYLLAITREMTEIAKVIKTPVDRNAPI